MSDRRRHRLPEDPTGIDQPHDVLAAEEFAMPTPSVGDIPPDPIHEPHDVLAAEEFAMPVGGPPEYSDGGLQPRTLIPSVLLGAAIAYLLLRLLRD
jgi:hypothetical protein